MAPLKYLGGHAVRNDRQLYGQVQDLKDSHLRKRRPLGKVIHDARLQVVKHALGTHTTTSRVQGAAGLLSWCSRVLAGAGLPTRAQ